jgi:hypothetical protein
MPRLARLSREWSDVVTCIAGDAVDSTLSLAAPPVGYPAALQIARLLLVGAGIDTVGGDGGEAFLVNMWSIWERAIRRMADGWAGKNAGWFMMHETERSRRWDDEREIADPTRWLTADVLLRSSSAYSIILDAKYKREFGVESRNDRHQMAAYCLAFDARTAVLIYPVVDQSVSVNRLLLRSSLAGKPTEIRSLGLPIADGPQRCAQVLGEHLDCMSRCLSRV